MFLFYGTMRTIMLQKLILLTIFLQVFIIVILFNVTFHNAFQNSTRLSLPYPSELNPNISKPETKTQSTGKMIQTQVTGEDARILIIERFIKRYRPDSPFLSYAHIIVEEADKNTIDFRLVPAIGMCESNLGRRLPSSDSFNAWGIAVYTNKNTGKHFADWGAAIAWVSTFIREKFYDRGVTDLWEIGAIWAPPSVQNNYSWSRCVQGFMNKME